jgi:hypothetical protein
MSRHNKNSKKSHLITALNSFCYCRKICRNRYEFPYFKKGAQFSKQIETPLKTRSQPFCADAYLVKKTLFATPRPLYHWKAETLSFLHVLLVLGVNLGSLLTLSFPGRRLVSDFTLAIDISPNNGLIRMIQSKKVFVDVLAMRSRT